MHPDSKQWVNEEKNENGPTCLPEKERVPLFWVASGFEVNPKTIKGF